MLDKKSVGYWIRYCMLTAAVNIRRKNISEIDGMS